MLDTPTKFTLVSGFAEGKSRLNAFDNALLKSGIGDLNLLKVSSVLPPGAREVAQLQIPPGSLVPTAYGAIESREPGQLIAAAVGVGMGEPGESGVIMEFSGLCSQKVADEQIRAMVEEAFDKRARRLLSVRTASVEHRVVSIGCALAAVALWY